MKQRSILLILVALACQAIAAIASEKIKSQTPDPARLQELLSGYKTPADVERLEDAFRLATSTPEVRSDANWPEAKKTKMILLGMVLAKASGIEFLQSRGPEPTTNMAAPLETGMPAGVAPWEIKNPTLRAKYEADLAENHKRLQESRAKERIRMIQQHCLDYTKAFIERCYPNPEVNGELKGLLKEAGLSAKDFDQIIQKANAPR